MTVHHDWRLVAPWYRWPRPEGAARRRGRGTAPVIQKYDDSKLVDAFLADPQRSRRYRDDEDRVHRLVPIQLREPETLIGSGPLRGFRRSLATARLVRTDTRKLFLATHKRFYLVVCDLRCDAPGFPRANRDEVCEAGLVVRRRFVRCPESAREEAHRLLAEITGLQASLMEIDRPEPKRRRRRRVLRSRNGSGPADSDARRLALLEAIAARRRELRRLASKRGAETLAEGWVPSDADGIGAWQPVEARPQAVVEHVTPLFPLVPDPRERRHAGRYGTLYFGVLPTASSDHDPQGNARFDDVRLYHARCFVRRHRPECPKTGEPNDCGGTVFWSEPTEAYRLAAPFDLEGAAHRPITIKLPDLRELAAQALAKPFGFSPVKMEAPPASSLQFGVAGMLPVAPSIGQLTCFWSIPLITIVALFVLNLFLPIVVMLFGLWWMLLLKFCFGGVPSFSLDVDVAANIASLDEGLPDARINELRAKLKAGLDAQLATPGGGVPPPSARIDSEKLGSKAVAEFQQTLLQPQEAGPDPLAGLEWETPVEPDPELEPEPERVPAGAAT